ncbi:MAG: hypothetical protein CM1200mP29_17050 [Verrucomicrobiota bacterium]|nr:MAG: hypothetical protein CM1200mP29_17050 [Verrucomicrobiota bacterium]
MNNNPDQLIRTSRRVRIPREISLEPRTLTTALNRPTHSRAALSPLMAQCLVNRGVTRRPKSRVPEPTAKLLADRPDSKHGCRHRAALEGTRKQRAVVDIWRLRRGRRQLHGVARGGVDPARLGGRAAPPRPLRRRLRPERGVPREMPRAVQGRHRTRRRLWLHRCQGHRVS